MDLSRAQPEGVPAVRALMRNVPPLRRVSYHFYRLVQEVFGLAATRPGLLRWTLAQACRLHLRLAVADPALRAKLTPDYRPMCKRQVFSAGLYPAVQRPDVTLVTEPISHFDEHGIVTADGVLHRVDAIVLATGFDTRAYLRPMAGRSARGLAPFVRRIGEEVVVEPPRRRPVADALQFFRRCGGEGQDRPRWQVVEHLLADHLRAARDPHGLQPRARVRALPLCADGCRRPPAQETADRASATAVLPGSHTAPWSPSRNPALLACAAGGLSSTQHSAADLQRRGEAVRVRKKKRTAPRGTR
ncbi:hypothetical protein ACIQ8D_35370 [Streptomyces sp. NPDC096094]|uniref:hypothetical protein n=1 Tax=Streptomyces sp. NPDC096094 TaxID=3366073 RepID=UPI0038083087